MTEKKLIYETPEVDILWLQLASSCLVASAEDHFIDDSDPYFDLVD